MAQALQSGWHRKDIDKLEKILAKLPIFLGAYVSLQLSNAPEPIPTSWGVGLVGRTMALFKSLSISYNNLISLKLELSYRVVLPPLNRPLWHPFGAERGLGIEGDMSFPLTDPSLMGGPDGCACLDRGIPPLVLRQGSVPSCDRSALRQNRGRDLTLLLGRAGKSAFVALRGKAVAVVKAMSMIQTA